MWSFFRGWRRKVGVVTLVIACVFMAGWVRSYVIQDVFRVDCEESSLIAHSVFGTIRIGLVTKSHKFRGNLSWQSFELAKHGTLFDRRRCDWHWEYAGFSVGSMSFPERERHLGFPYLVIGPSATLLSAYLLLVKPRPKKATTQPPESP